MSSLIYYGNKNSPIFSRRALNFMNYGLGPTDNCPENVDWNEKATNCPEAPQKVGDKNIPL
jgi:hypothetical protein